jgi:predicted transcriptional regulator
VTTNATTQRILELVESSPGLHFRGLLRQAGLTSTGQLRYHVDRLVRAQKIMEVDDGGFTRYFAAGTYDRRFRDELVRLARPLPRRVARLLLQQEMTRTSIRRQLDCADSTLGYYLSRMEQEGLVERRRTTSRNRYALVDPAGVRRVLALQAQHARAIRAGAGDTPSLEL